MITPRVPFCIFLQQKNFVNFQILCVIVAMLSCAAMCYSGLNMTVAEKYQPLLDEKGIALASTHNAVTLAFYQF